MNAVLLIPKERVDQLKVELMNAEDAELERLERLSRETVAYGVVDEEVV